MDNLFRTLINRASWLRIFVAFLLTLVGAVNFYGPRGLYTQLTRETGALPETLQGLRPGQTLAYVGGLLPDFRGAYLTFQLYDLFFQAAAATFVALLLARAIKAFPSHTDRALRLLALPLVLLALECFENLFLALMTWGVAPPALESVQQGVTTLKLWLVLILLPLALTAFLLAAIDGFRVAIGAKKA